MGLSKVGSWAAIVGTAAIIGGGAGFVAMRFGADAGVDRSQVEDADETGEAPPEAQPSRGPRYSAPLPKAPPPVARVVPVLPDYQGQLAAQAAERRLAQARAMVRSSDPEQRSEGLVALLNEVPAEAVEAARGMIRDRDAEVAPHAARIVGTGGQALDAAEITALQEMVEDTSIPQEQRSGLNAAVLGTLEPGPERLEWMAKALESDATYVRGGTVAAVVPLPTEQAVPLLAKALSDPDERVAAGALNGLVHMHGGDPKLGKDPAAWARWLEERAALRERAAAEELAMRNPVIENPPEAAPPGADPDERKDPAEPQPTEAP